MSEDYSESTRVMSTSVPPADRTMVAPTGGLAVAPPPGATQIGTTVVCAVCNTPNGGFETYCAECGFLLTSAPGVIDAPSAEEEAGFELAEASTGRRFVLRIGTTTVGRESCDVLLMDGTVSRRHAQIAVEGGQVTVTDLGSTNGTQVNGNRLAPNTPTVLSPGDTVRFGNASLTLASTGASAEATIAVSVPPADVTMVAGAAPPDAATTPSEPPTEPAASPAGPGLYRFRAQTPGASSFEVGEGETTIGRRAGNTVVIGTDPYISGRHAVVEVNPTGCYLTDVGSTNGSLVNGTKMEANVRQLLLDGDEVTLGQSSFLFETLEPEDGEEEGGSEEAVSNESVEDASESVLAESSEEATESV